MVLDLEFLQPKNRESLVPNMKMHLNVSRSRLYRRGAVPDDDRALRCARGFSRGLLVVGEGVCQILGVCRSASRHGKARVFFLVCRTIRACIAVHQK